MRRKGRGMMRTMETQEDSDSCGVPTFAFSHEYRSILKLRFLGFDGIRRVSSPPLKLTRIPGPEAKNGGSLRDISRMSE